jgi:Uma2 family endonuclease
MTVLAERPTTEEKEASARRFTVADLAALPDELPSGPVKWELWDGALRIMSPPHDFHGSVLIRIGTIFTVYGEWEGHGRTTGADSGVVIQPQTPQACLCPDVAFLTSDQLPAKHTKEGYLLTIPAVMVEVRSKNDSAREVQEKVDRYLAAGARLVWVADPKRKVVTVFESGGEPRQLGEGDILTAEGIIPSLAFPVARLFEGLDE